PPKGDKSDDDAHYRREAARQLRASEAPVAEMPSRSTPDGPTAFAAMCDTATYMRERPGAFVLEDGVAYHTYSAYARGLDGLWGAYQWLDRGAPRGATRRASGGAAMMSTISAEPGSWVSLARSENRTSISTNRRLTMWNQVVSHEDWLKARLERLE